MKGKQVRVQVGVLRDSVTLENVLVFHGKMSACYGRKETACQLP